ncbi:MAG: hypothetical protein BGO55_08480 [Sphingobacteriales bacterium 50-39]|nr:hypothetical protein [Sphingobacteriales bacterium]OJW59299.1 MAG: hypothetical protein BGO55_08480 [Sphingobacteriales bacterium 50-39]
MKENISQLLDSVTDYTIKALTVLKENGIKKELYFPLDCGMLEDFNYVNIETAPRYEKMFRELRGANGPALYWFDLQPGTDTSAIIKALEAYKLTRQKNTPALRQKINFDTATLYVGKVKKGIAGRIVTHLGFFKVVQTQGLQLYHWARPLALYLGLHVIEFNQGMEDILPIFEHAFARELQPLIGKHI